MSVDFDRMAANLPADQRKELSRKYRRGAKNETAAFLSCFFLGIFGAHWFYLGEWSRGFARLILPALAAIALVAGALGALPSLAVTVLVVVLLGAGFIWEFVDLFQIDRNVRKRNLTLAESLIGAGALADSSTLKDAVARLDSAVVGAGVGAGGAEITGMITADDISAARAMADEHSNAIMEEFDSITTKQISDDPNATSPGEPVSWSETAVTQDEPEASGAVEGSPEATLATPAPEFVIHTHTETADSVTDSYEFDHLPDATALEASPTAQEAEAATWPDHPSLDEAVDEAGESAPAPGAAGDAGSPLAEPAAVDAAVVVGAEHSGPDVTDHYAYIPHVNPIADVEGTGAAPQYVALPEESTEQLEAMPDPTSEAPLVVDASTAERDATDTHPPSPLAEPVADVGDVNLAQPVYIELPAEVYVPPVVPPEPVAAVDGATSAQPDYAELPAETYVPPVVPLPPEGEADGAGVGDALAVGMAGAASLESSQPQEPEAAPTAVADGTVEAAPASGPLMKRIRMKRQIVVDGQVVREETVEKLVPVDTDTSELVAEMDTELGHATKEEIAELANLDPDESIDLRQRTELPQQSDEPLTE
ncbi:MAG TPA: NINE protein [Ktedonobacterales bacterium]|nr:NINE protein [Ktedonobacterales bacterium]